MLVEWRARKDDFSKPPFLANRYEHDVALSAICLAIPRRIGEGEFPLSTRLTITLFVSKMNVPQMISYSTFFS